MELSDRQKKALRGIAHARKVLVQVGNAGISEALVDELDAALVRHELVKVRVRAGDREARDAMIGELATRCRASLVGRVGNVATLFRRNRDKPRIELP